MGETERLTVDIIAELQETIATQREVICNLNAMNDELQAKLDRIEQIVSDYGLTNVNLLSDDLTDFEKDILREILEQDN
jgi:chromosome condensin MukBEF complex kleisin-like MukF subunit